MIRSIVALSFLSCVLALYSKDGPTVYVPGLGYIKGVTNFTSQYEHRLYYVFRGIPFAEPITDDQRFQPSVAHAPWDDGSTVFQATKYGRRCPQGSGGLLMRDTVESFEHTETGEEFEEPVDDDETRGGNEEDCLVLNVHTPKLPSRNETVSLPVLVFIHGGSFTGGSLIPYWARRFMDQDIVLVTIQYRLGPLGFLCLQTEEAPGNAGLYDQLLALQWVKNYIAPFGGDPERITINGQSAGSASVSYQMLTPLAKGLFRGIIGESGAALSFWAIDTDPVNDGMRFGSYVGCNQTTPSEVAQCLKTLPVRDILNGFSGFKNSEYRHGRNGFAATSPCVQDISPKGIGKFISESPVKLLLNGEFNHVPILYGSVKTEGSFIMSMVYHDFLVPNGLDQDENFLKNGLVQAILRAVGIYDPTGAVADAATQRYLTGLPIGDLAGMMPGLVDMAGAFFLKASTYETAKYNSYYNTTYWYTFDYDQGPTLFHPPSYYPYGGGGVAHADELIYMYLPYLIFLMNDNNTMMSKQMIQMWTNFVTYQDPTPDGVGDEELNLTKWTPFTVEEPNFLRILGPYNLTIQNDYPKLWTIMRDEALQEGIIPTEEPTK